MTLSGPPVRPVDPTVTVVLPVHDAEQFVEDAVNSIRTSTYENWRCIVIDDGSTDATLARARAAAVGDPRFVFVVQPNGGHIAAINRAAAEITRDVGGDLVALLDGDDVFLPDKLAVAVGVARARPTAGLVTHRMYVADEHLRIVGVAPLASRLLDGDLRRRPNSLTKGESRLGVTSGMVLRRDVFDRIFPTDPAISRFPDELVRRIAPLVAEVASCERPLGIRRIHGRNQSDDARGELGSYLQRSLASYRLIAREQGRHARDLAIELPGDDVDLDLMAALLAHLDRSDDARRWRSRVTTLPGFAELGPARSAFWRCLLWLPPRLATSMARQLFGASNATLLLNRMALLRLRRAGAVPATPPRPELSWRALVRMVWAGA
jgi:glycosyltransferase involved in cell wall biosynthesis